MATDGGLGGLFQKNLPEFHWQRIETGLTGRGIPDLNYCHDGREGWIEAKATAGWTVGLRPEQTAWLLRRSRAGGRVWIAVRRQSLRRPVDELWLVPGHLARAVQDEGLRASLSEWRTWQGGPSRWDWGEVRRSLLK